MSTKVVKCPTCKNELQITGEAGKKMYLNCPKCATKGVYTFPMDKKINVDTGKSIAIEVNGLTKQFNSFIAVNDVSFSVTKGEIFGFLGPNGAGKTTTIKSILGLIHANVGQIKINGLDIKTSGKEAKKYIGYLPERVAFYDNLTALQNLTFYAEMKNIPKSNCHHLIKEYGLADAVQKKVGAFSKGMIQRLGMARAVMGNPLILILDEPTEGLDPRGVVLIRKKIQEMKKKGSTIFVSSHILSEIQEICDRVGIIHKGRLVARDSVSQLSKKLNLKPKITIQLETITDTILESVAKVPGVDSVDPIGKSIDVVCHAEAKAKVIIAIAKSGGNIINLYTREPSLEEVFMRFTEEQT